MKTVVGISQKIKRAWVDAVLDRLVETTDERELRRFIDAELQSELPGKASRAKRVGMISSIWASIPRERMDLRDRAVEMLPRISGQERIWLHWGMTVMAYPFFRDVAEVVGRLLALQDDFTTAQVQARTYTSWGDRVTTKRAAKYLLNTLVDWGVLRSTKAKAHFLLARKMTASTPELELWLLEALLTASAVDEIEAQQLLRLPESFPFSISLGIADLRRNEAFNIHRQGLDLDMVAVCKAKLLQPQIPHKKPAKKPLTSPRQMHRPIESLRHLAPSEAEPAQTPSKASASANVNGKHHGEGDRRQIEDLIRHDMLLTLSARAARFLDVRGIELTAEGPFAAATVECVGQFRDGHYLGCIALAHITLEAAVRRIWQVTLKRKPNHFGDFQKNVDALYDKRVLDGDWKKRLDQAWAGRSAIHDLHPWIEADQKRLEDMARQTLLLLNEFVREFFGFLVRDGLVIPDHPEFWSTNDREVLMSARQQDHP